MRGSWWCLWSWTSIFKWGPNTASSISALPMSLELAFTHSINLPYPVVPFPKVILSPHVRTFSAWGLERECVSTKSRFLFWGVCLVYSLRSLLFLLVVSSLWFGDVTGCYKWACYEFYKYLVFREQYTCSFPKWEILKNNYLLVTFTVFCLFACLFLLVGNLKCSGKSRGSACQLRATLVSDVSSRILWEQNSGPMFHLQHFQNASLNV